MTRSIIPLLLLTLFALGCNQGHDDPDATGTFEAEEVIISSEISGKIRTLEIEEGQTIQQGKAVGSIEAENLQLQKEQVEASIRALDKKTLDPQPQIELLHDQLAVQKAQLNSLLREQKRTENLFKADAATGKQLDDINSQVEVARRQIAVTQQQINVQKNNIATQNQSILSEKAPLKKRVAQLNEQLKHAEIINPVHGTVLATYAEAGEVTSPGKAIYKLADLSNMTLRAYITGSQLSEVKLGQGVTVRIDAGEGGYRNLKGTVTWISDKAEFTPKTIQTKDERANLVYAIKVDVRNDGSLKIGMYGDMFLATE
ncbi:MAG TPA: HlyD family efflux transporter periplasmic adaptor subunit [Sphingobacteriaceae bacterium]